MRKVPIEISARHIHLTEDALQALFGAGHALTCRKALSQPGEFVCVERVDVEGPKGTLKGVSVIGPVRKKSQVEISLTDARTLGIAVPVRESGDTAGSAPVKLIGPAGETELAEGLIAAKRHIHLTPEKAEEFGVSNGEIAAVRVATPARPLIFENVAIRVSERYSPAMHIDTDEANAAGITAETFGEIIK